MPRPSGYRARASPERQLRRLVEELGEIGLDLDGAEPWHRLAVDEIDYALRPDIHERRVPSYGAVIEPDHRPGDVGRRHRARRPAPAARRPLAEAARCYADGMSSWLIRRLDGDDEWVVFDRPAGSERDLVVLAETLGAMVVQRHPAGMVRVVGRVGVFRWDGRRWQHQPLVSAWVDTVGACAEFGDRDVLETLLEFAVHDLGARGIGATLVYRPGPRGSTRGSTNACRRHRRSGDAPGRPRSVASRPLPDRRGGAVRRHRGAHPDRGAPGAERPRRARGVDGYRGTRHTSARRYSSDDPTATVIVVSEDGPVTVLRHGDILGASVPSAAATTRATGVHQ